MLGTLIATQAWVVFAIYLSPVLSPWVGLRSIAFLSGFALAVIGFRAWVQIFRTFKSQFPAWLYRVFIISFFAQIFWVIFKAPLDVDGIFYHIPIALEALQKDKWGSWDIPLWHIRNNPKFGEINTLCAISLGGPWGYRLSGMGHFFTAAIAIHAIIGLSFSVREITMKRLGAHLGIILFSMPIFIKQMGAHYVDIAAWTYFLAGLTLFGEAQSPTSRQVRLGIVAIALHSAVKFSGPLTSIAPFLFLIWKFKVEVIKRNISLITLCMAGALGSWMIPNYLQFGNPIFPMNLTAALHFDFKNLIPAIAGVGEDYHPRLKDDLPLPLSFLSQFLMPAAAAVYDHADFAWGLFGMLAVMGILIAFAKNALATPVFIKSFVAHPLFPLGLTVFLGFILMPKREIPRHSFLMGYGLVVLAYIIYKDKIYKNLGWFHFLIAIQLLFAIPDRALYRGIVHWSSAPGVIMENFKDIVAYGEPQAEGRWLHYPYVRRVRTQEPRVVTLTERSGTLLAPYFGRKFSNQVVVGPGFCRWPHCEGNELMPKEANGGAGSED